MSKDDMSILVVPTHLLFPENKPEGFVDHNTIDLMRVMMTHMKYMRRGDAEIDVSHKQAIPHCVIVNPEKKLVFGFRRSLRAEDYNEARLRGKWALGIGGHVDEGYDSGDNPIVESMLRELDEEVEFKNHSYINHKLVGYINSEKDEVSQVHIGLLFLVETDAEEVLPKHPEIAKGGFLSQEEFDEIMRKAVLPESDVNAEEWALISAKWIRKYFDSLLK